MKGLCGASGDFSPVLWRNASLQAGGFFSPAGHNALVEQGASLSLWLRF